MKLLTAIFITGALIMFNGCLKKNNPVDPVEVPNSTLSGTLQYQGAPLAGAVVQVDEIDNWKTTSDADGSFQLGKVSRGAHTLHVYKEMSNGTLLQKVVSLNVTEESVKLGTLTLQNAPVLNEITKVSGEEAVSISWSGISSSDVTGYKIYRNIHPGVNDRDTTSELVHETSGAADTSFIDKSYRTGVTNYYRVFAYYSDGSIGGSNLATYTVAEVNYVKDGDFETIAEGVRPKNWMYRTSGSPTFNYFGVSDEDKHNGSRSLKVTYSAAEANPDPSQGAWGGIYQHILTDKWIPGKRYTLNFWSKTEIGNFQVRIVKNRVLEDVILNYTVVDDSNWKNRAIDFEIDSETTSIEVWFITKPELSEGGFVKGFIDDVKIIK